MRGGRGHKYWSHFDNYKEEIEAIGAEIHNALYSPVLQEPITTLDIPVAGKGYNALQFVFFLVNICNSIPIPKSTTEKKTAKALPPDLTGEQTLTFLKKVKKDIELLTTNDRGSLGLHPAVYFYANSGSFLPAAFLAALEFVKELDRKNKKKDFIRVRKEVENYLFEHRTFISMTVSRLGSGGRSINRSQRTLYESIFGFLRRAFLGDQITKEFTEDKAFAHFAIGKIPSPRQAEGPSPKGKIATSTKSAVYLRDAWPGVLSAQFVDRLSTRTQLAMITR